MRVETDWECVMVIFAIFTTMAKIAKKTLTISPWRKSKFFRQVANDNNTPTFLHYFIILTFGYFLDHAAVSICSYAALRCASFLHASRSEYFMSAVERGAWYARCQR